MAKATDEATSEAAKRVALALIGLPIEAMGVATGAGFSAAVSVAAGEDDAAKLAALRALGRAELARAEEREMGVR